MQRYAPESARENEIAHIIQRYAAIAVKEKAACGFARGMNDLAATLAHQPRTPMSDDLFDRFTGAAAVREALRELGIQAGTRMALIECGKNENVIRRVLAELDIAVVDDEADAEALMIGTLSPGPMLDAWGRRRDDERVRMPCNGFLPAVKTVQQREGAAKAGVLRSLPRHSSGAGDVLRRS
jgi:hypothetical protein